MSNTMTACVGRYFETGGPDKIAKTQDLARHKLERLRELRAVIDTLRCEQSCADPLLALIFEQESVENRPCV